RARSSAASPERRGGNSRMGRPCAALGSFGLEFSFELLFRQLADQRLGQFLAELDFRRHFNLGNARPQEFQNLVCRGLLSVTELDIGLGAVAAIGLRYAYDARLLHGRMLIDRLLDPARIDIET